MSKSLTNGKKTYLGILVVFIPVIAGLFGYDVSEAFPVEFARFAEEIFMVIGGGIAAYGRAVATMPGWFAKK